MGSNSKIEWTHHTFNPWWGCLKVSPGCAHCYADTLAHRYGYSVWGPAADTNRRPFGDKHWNEPRAWNRAAEKAGERRRVFCASMADVFEDHPQLPAEREKLWPLIKETPWLDWLLLTKRAENIKAMLPNFVATLPNVWIGVSVENQEQADKRIPLLLKIPVAVRFLSCEPLFEKVLLDNGENSYLTCDGRLMDETDGNCCEAYAVHGDHFHGIDWVIAGGESGPGARPMHPDWARSLRDQCQDAGVPFHFKQWGEWLHESQFTCEHQRDTGLGSKRSDAGGGFQYVRVGKKVAGRLLDGREWNGFPVVEIGNNAV